MLNYENQLNLGNIYSECQEMFKEQRPEFLELLDKYIDINTYIPYSFKKAFYADTGRPRGCSLYGYPMIAVSKQEKAILGKYGRARFKLY